MSASCQAGNQTGVFFMAKVNQTDLSKILNPQPHPIKKELQDLGISPHMAANYVGRTYQHVLHQLTGKYPMSETIQKNEAPAQIWC